MTVPLAPAKQVVSLEWNQPVAAGLVQKAPRVDLGQPAVNARIDFNLPSDRWVLWVHGPASGPCGPVLELSHRGDGRRPGSRQGDADPARRPPLAAAGPGDSPRYPPGAHWSWSDGSWRWGFENKKDGPQNAVAYNFAQMALVVLTAVALACLYTAIENGLLGIPRMQISGNGSGDFSLHWMQDRIEGTMPQPWTLTLHLWIYHILMLAWALWLAPLPCSNGCAGGGNASELPAYGKKIRFRRKKDVPPPIRSNIIIAIRFILQYHESIVDKRFCIYTIARIYFGMPDSGIET